MSFAISTENVSKVYRLGEINRSQLLGDIRTWFRRSRDSRNTFREPPLNPDGASKSDTFWALRDVSFDIQEGETVGIIGANGAGKSTLLKVISRITSPSLGTLRIRGRVGSLLEVGTGFNPELTGRDNVFLNGAILGMNRLEIAAKFDDIVSFSGVQKFIDTPVKRYSSGMFVRLAFAVAAFLEPEILIVDEVLSVGDQQFQNRCLQRIEEVIRDGRTLLFVSHGAPLIRRVCKRAICLVNGSIACDADVNTTMEFYQASSSQKPEIAKEAGVSPQPPAFVGSVIFPESKRPGSDTAQILSIKAMDPNGELITTVPLGQSVEIAVTFQVLKSGHYLRPAAYVSDELANIIFWTCDIDAKLRRTSLACGVYLAKFTIPGDLLAPGRKTISIGVGEAEGSGRSHALAPDALTICVEDDFSENATRGGYTGPLPGFIRPRLSWSTQPA